MKRLPISYVDLLRDILPRNYLSDGEVRALEAALSSGSTAEIRATAQRLIQALIDRKHLEIVERIPRDDGQLVRLTDRRRDLRFLIRLDEPRTTEALEVIPLPLTPTPIAGIRADLVRQMISDQGNLVLSDRVAGPREIVQRLEPVLRDALSIDGVTLLPIQQPPSQVWETSSTTPPPLPAVRLHELARARTYLLLVRDFARLDPKIGAVHRTGSGLYIGIGDEVGCWHAVLEARDGRRDAFPQERIHLAVLLAGHFQTLLANSVRLQSFLFFDYLTGLYNRPYFEDQFEKMVSSARRHSQGFALCIVDIDDFRNFNTLYGFDGGDRVLATVGCILKAAVRTSDTISRYGGEEFTALLAPPVTPDEAMAIAERLRHAVEVEPFQVRNLSGRLVPERITISLGGALYPTDGPGPREIWTAANQMLLEAKRLGKNRIRFGGRPVDPTGTERIDTR